MKTNIRTPKKRLFAQSDIFYVSSKSGGDEHIVVRAGKTLFCDCKDFMTRKLPLFGTSGFSLCRHGKKVSEKIFESGTPELPKPVKKFGVFFKNSRSFDISKTFDSFKDAQDAIYKYEGKKRNNFRHVEELGR